MIVQLINLPQINLIFDYDLGLIKTTRKTILDSTFVSKPTRFIVEILFLGV